MKRLFFERLTIVSRRSRAGRVMAFPEGTTVIHGPNGTGKSSLLKTLFWTMGADAKVTNPSWHALNVRALVEYRVGLNRYAIMRRGKQFSLFANGALVGNTRSVTTGVAPFFADTVGFGLVLPNRKTQSPTIPPPSYYFVPYYIDQDSGWTDPLNSHSGLSQFQRWQDPVTAYHAGIRSNRAFEIEAELARLRDERREPSQELRALERVLSDVEEMLKSLPVSFTLEEFEQEVRHLNDTVSRLYAQQNEHQRQAAQLAEEAALLRAQIAILTQAADELDADLIHASLAVDDEVECPTCMARYSNDFVARFALSEDQERCLDLRSELKVELGTVTERQDALRASLAQVETTIEQVREALDQRLGELTLHDVAKMKGKQELRDVIGKRTEQVAAQIAEIDRQIAVLTAERESEAKAAKARKREITGNFTALLSDYARRLGLDDFADAVPNRIKFSIKETGSQRPRAILAYTLALHAVARQHAPCAMPPLVIDSPNQQDLDADNWARVLALIAEEFPAEEQLILATVRGFDTLDAEQLINVGERKSALQEESFDHATEVMRQYALAADA